ARRPPRCPGAAVCIMGTYPRLTTRFEQREKRLPGHQRSVLHARHRRDQRVVDELSRVKLRDPPFAEQAMRLLRDLLYVVAVVTIKLLKHVRREWDLVAPPEAVGTQR